MSAKVVETPDKFFGVCCIYLFIFNIFPAIQLVIKIGQLFISWLNKMNNG